MKTSSEDAAAVEHLLVRRGDAWSRYAVLLTGNATDAQDLVQEALLRMLEASDRVAHADHPDAYAKRILTNIFLNNRRRQVHLQRLLPRLGLSGSPSTQDPSDGQATRDELWRALNHLSARQRAAVVLRYYDDASYENIASMLDCRPATARSLVLRGLSHLRVVIADPREE